MVDQKDDVKEAASVGGLGNEEKMPRGQTVRVLNEAEREWCNAMQEDLKDRMNAEHSAAVAVR